MLNIEKYIDELIEIGIVDVEHLYVKDGKPYSCEGKFNDKPCEELAKEWLFSEYEEPEIDWRKIKVDTPILVRDSEDELWNRRYFAGFENGSVYAWDNGTTSWSSRELRKVFGEYAKLAESEE